MEILHASAMLKDFFESISLFDHTLAYRKTQLLEKAE